MNPENTGEKQVKGRFSKGQSGNPSGRPQGARNQSTILAEYLLENQTEEICKVVIAEARTGNMQAAKIILDRILPPKKDRPIKIDLPELGKSRDLAKTMACVVNAVSSGSISPSEGESVARILDIHARTLELMEFEQRLSVLEKKT